MYNWLEQKIKNFFKNFLKEQLKFREPTYAKISEYFYTYYYLIL